MNNPYIDTSSGSRRYWIYCQTLHKKNLDKIKKKKVIQESILIDSRLKPRNISKVTSFQENERNTLIKKDNQHLLDKLLKIAQRNVNCIQKKPEGLAKSANTRSKTNPARKKEDERIKQENMRFAQKLMDLEPSLSVKKWDQDFERFSKYKQQIAKPHTLDIEAAARLRLSLPISTGRSNSPTAPAADEQPAETL